MKPNNADMICQRLEEGIQQDGDWILLLKEIEHGNPPNFYTVNFKRLRIRRKNGQATN